MAHNLSNEELAEFREIFNLVDRDGGTSAGVEPLPPRPGRGVPRLRGISASQPRRRRDASQTYPRGERYLASASANAARKFAVASALGS